MERYLEQLMEAGFTNIADPIPMTLGVYVFEQDGIFLYVGSAGDLERRLKHDLMSPCSHKSFPKGILSKHQS